MSGTVDLTTAGSFGSVGDAIFTTDTTHSAGTGGFNTFVQLQHNGTEQGYNTDASAQFDEKNGHTHNHALLLADVPIFIGDGSNGTLEGVAYREFKLDISEAKRLLSMDELQIWQEEAGNLTNFNAGGTGFAGAHTNHLVYDLDAGGDHWVALNSGLSSGSGGGDVRVLIRDDLFINDAAHRYVYLYSAFGQQGGTWASDGGFEEWGTGTPTGGSSGGAVLRLDKTASVNDGAADEAGDVITYSFVVSNFGSVALTGITVTDPSVSDLAPVTSGGFNVGDTDHDNQLDTNESWSYTAHHTLTQAEIDSNGGDGDGVIDNTATADSNQTGPVSDTAAVTIVRTPHASITKTAVIPDANSANDPTLNDGKIDSPADDIGYTITVVNDGNVTLNNVVLSDSLSGFLTIHTESGGSGINGDDILDVGETWTYTAAYDVQQADIDNHGSVDGTDDNNIHNTATVSSNEISGESASADVPIDYRPSATLVKEATVPGNTADHAGESINYMITVTNDGNVTLTNVQLDDTLVGTLTTHTESGGTGINGDDILDVGETWQYTASHVVTQAEMDAGGSIDNTASVTTDQGAMASDSASVPVLQNPHLAIQKSGTWEDSGSEPNGYADVGEQVHYTFTVTNDGNVTLHDTAVNDTLLGGPLAGPDSGDSVNPGVFDVGEIWVYHADYTITAEDTAAGNAHNEATASALGPQNQPVNDTAINDVALPQPPNAQMTLEKSGFFVDSNENGIADTGDGTTSGDLIQYVFVLANSGNLALSNVVLTDTVMDESMLNLDSGDNNNNNVLDVGETWTYSGNYFIQESDINDGSVNIHNEATATALDPMAQVVTSNTAMWDTMFPFV